MAEPPSTPPPPTAPTTSDRVQQSPLTPEQVKRIEINRLKAKALRSQRESSERQSSERQQAQNPPSLPRSSSNLSPHNLLAGQKRSHPSTSTSTSTSHPSTHRDARSQDPPANPPGFRPLDDIRPARNFAKFVEYDFSKMTDTKGGFLTAEDDPHNRALHAPSQDEKPAHMTLKEWERHQLLRSLREQKAGPFEPGLSVLQKEEKDQLLCRECGSLEIDWKWADVFGCAVCNGCKEARAEKYSLLTKTEAKEDYLLTDPELKDAELLPHLERPNPHKASWNNMMLYLRYQVEEYAFGRKWGSAGKLDEEFGRREGEKKKRKEDRFRAKLQELKKKTRVEAYRRGRQGGGTGAGGGQFGDEVGNGGRHTHVWGRSIENEEGTGVKTCVECGMEVEELEF